MYNSPEVLGSIPGVRNWYWVQYTETADQLQGGCIIGAGYLTEREKLNMTDDHDQREIKQPEYSKLISVKQAAEISGLSTRHIRLLLGRGTIWGVKMGRDWFTTEPIIQDYLALDRRPGPKTDK